MNKNLRKAGILLLVFAAATVVYFFSARNMMVREEAVYSYMDEPTFPIVYTEFQGKEINGLYGYIQDMENKVAENRISVLPEDRRLRLNIHEYGNTIVGISYEIRNLTMDRLVERTELDSWESQEGITRISLPIQNLLKKNSEYLLILNVNIRESNLKYYTKIMWPDNYHSWDMVQLAESFTRKSLNDQEARDLVSYLETNQGEDNSSLGYVTIRASFHHLTWDGLSPELVGEPRVILEEYDGIMGQVRVLYQVKLTDSVGYETLVNAEDNFTMKWNEQRIYMMNYERYANEIFDGKEDHFSGKRILLGISDGQRICREQSENSRYLVFKTGGDLWRYDQKEDKILCIFTFSGKEHNDIRSEFGSHDVKIMSVNDEGDVDFLVYGYMNRGIYEGRTGVVLYHYDHEKNQVQEKFFIPVAASFAQIESDVHTLSYMNESGMIYLMLDGSVFGIDLNSSESVVIAQGLRDGNYAVSRDCGRIAWQEGDSFLRSDRIHVMDFDTSGRQDILADSGDYARVLGFVGSDLIYGLSRESDMWIANGMEKEIPMYALYIVDDQMNVESEYKKEGIYLSDVVTEDGRIHLKRLVKSGENQYVFQNDDTIVCNEKLEEDSMEGIGWYASQDRGRQYFVQTDSEIKMGHTKLQLPETFSHEASSMLEIASETAVDNELLFYSYGGGRYLGSSYDFQEASAMAYDRMGYVTDQNGRMIWNRINRSVICNLKEPWTKSEKLRAVLEAFGGNNIYDELMVLDCSGCGLNQMLYFIDKGIPVIAYMEDGSYLLLTGYDAYNVTLYSPELQESWKMGQGDATAYFEGLGNSFFIGLPVE